MDHRLFEAARVGKIEDLNAILEDDPIALERITLLPVAETPLHVATLTEQVEFVKEIMRLKPCFAQEVNKDGLIPLHIACATGNLDIVRVLLNPNPELCLVRDKGGWTSLHFATLRGRVVVVKELLSQCPQVANEVTFDGDSAFHLAVKNSRVDVLKVLLEELGDKSSALVNARNGHGHTVTELAVSMRQVQVMRLLNASTEESVDDQLPSLAIENIRMHLDNDQETKSSTSKKSKSHATSFDDRPEEAILRTFTTGLDRMAPVVASVIASTTYSAALSPPKTLYKENMKLDLRCFQHMKFRRVVSFEDLPQPTTACPSFTFVSFISFNTAGFLTAVLIIFLHPNARLAPVLLSSALMFLTITYISLTIAMSPNILTFLVIYGTSIIAFLLVLFYVTIFKSVLRWFIREWIKVTKKIKRGSHEGKHGIKGIFCC